jgi:4-diphosphocytidyl-2-C-methyl-D-erythritol kinase
MTGAPDGLRYCGNNRALPDIGPAGTFTPVQLRESAPAKLNLSLAVTGRQPDGFHQLLSLVAPLALADDLSWELGGTADVLSCDNPSLPTGTDNLVLRAAAAFRRRYPAAAMGHWHLAKRIPHGAGLGGGSSDAAAALRLLNGVSGFPFSLHQLREISLEVGSDCALFIEPTSAVIRGRGEQVAPLVETMAEALRGREVVLCKPSWGVSTAEAYAWKAARGGYQDVAQAERGLAEALASPDPLRALINLGNDLQAVVAARHPALQVGLDLLLNRFGVRAAMTGSGSACFMPGEGAPAAESLQSVLGEAWGPGTWVETTRLS